MTTCEMALVLFVISIVGIVWLSIDVIRWKVEERKRRAWRQAVRRRIEDGLEGDHGAR